MKKSLLILLSGFALTSQAQDAVKTETFTKSTEKTYTNVKTSFFGVEANKGTGVTDTLNYRSTAQASGPYTSYVGDMSLASIDSGRVYGTSYLGYNGFAQLYESIDAVAPVDTTINILGLVYRMSGRVATNSTKSVSFNIWQRDAINHPVTGRSKFFVYGLPSTSAISRTVQLPQLTLGASTPMYFSTQLTGVSYSFYAGYTINYTWAGIGQDTIGLVSTTATSPNFYDLASNNDTLINANVAVRTSSNQWQSGYYHLGLSSSLNSLVIYPIIQLDCPNCGPVSVKGFKANNLSFYGNYPNPAVGYTNVRFDLKNNADVTVTLMDIAGKTVATVKKAGNKGSNEVRIETSNLAAGNYTYLVETSEGDGVASKLTVIK